MMQRPASIVRFEQLYGLSILLGVIATALSWSQTIATPAVAQASEEIGAWYFPATIAFGIAIQLLLWFFAARRRSAIAKWVLVVFFALNFVGSGVALLSGRMPMAAGSLVAVLAVVAYAAAIWMLFRPESAVWFREKPGNAA